MKFCTKCGQKSDDQSTFCVNCGAPFSESKAIPNEPSEPLHTTPVQSDIAQAPVKKPNRKQKIGAIIAALAILLLVVAHFILSDLYDPVKKVQAMNEAYNSKDKEALFQQFTMKSDTVASAEDFYALVNEYGWTELRNQLMNEAEKVKAKQPTDIIYNKGEFISTNPKPQILGLYQDAEFRIIPTTVSIEAPYKNMNMTFGNQEVTSTEDEETIVLGDYLPGTYDWSYTYDEGLAPLSGSGTVDLDGQENNEQLVVPEWDFTTVTLDSDIKDAIVFINDQSTKKTVAELKELHPVQLDPSMKLHAVFTDTDGKAQTSEKVAMDTTSIYLPFDYIEKQQALENHEQTVKNLFRSFRNDYADAIYYADFDYIERYFKDGTKIKQDYAKFVYDHRNIPGYDYDFLLNDITSFKALSDTKFELYSFETFDFESNADDRVFYQRKKKYTISSIGDDFYIDSIVDLDTKKTVY